MAPDRSGPLLGTTGSFACVDVSPIVGVACGGEFMGSAAAFGDDTGGKTVGDRDVGTTVGAAAREAACVGALGTLR